MVSFIAETKKMHIQKIFTENDIMSETIESLLKNGQTSLNLGNSKDALLFYNQVLENDSKHVTALLKKATFLEGLVDTIMQLSVTIKLLLKKKIFWHY